MKPLLRTNRGNLNRNLEQPEQLFKSAFLKSEQKNPSSFDVQFGIAYVLFLVISKNVDVGIPETPSPLESANVGKLGPPLSKYPTFFMNDPTTMTLVVCYTLYHLLYVLQFRNSCFVKWNYLVPKTSIKISQFTDAGLCKKVQKSSFLDLKW